MNYSNLFHTEHDESTSIGNIGRGSHYSVLSMPQWIDVDRELAKSGEARIQRFAVIWDEDHDTRIIKVLEQAHLKGLIYPVRFIGERKGYLTILVDAEFYARHDKKIKDYESYWRKIVEISIDDCWEVEVSSEWQPSGLIADNESTVKTYLKNIENLWNLGLQRPSLPDHSRMVKPKAVTAWDSMKQSQLEMPAECQPWPLTPRD